MTADLYAVLDPEDVTDLLRRGADVVMDAEMKKIFGRDMWYDRAGQPIEWSVFNQLHSFVSNIIVSRTKLRRVKRRRWTRCTVSTVWLGMDHGHDLDTPIIFETMIFEGPWDGHQWRYATIDGARRGHRLIVEQVSAEIAERIERKHPRRPTVERPPFYPSPGYKYRHRRRHVAA